MSILIFGYSGHPLPPITLPALTAIIFQSKNIRRKIWWRSMRHQMARVASTYRKSTLTTRFFFFFFALTFRLSRGDRRKSHRSSGSVELGYPSNICVIQNGYGSLLCHKDVLPEYLRKWRCGRWSQSLWSTNKAPAADLIFLFISKWLRVTIWRENKTQQSYPPAGLRSL